MNSTTRSLICALGLCGLGSTVTAQQYRPSNANPSGEQLVAVFVGARSLGYDAPEFRRAVESAKVLLEQQARQSGRQFRAVGVSLDWNASVGVDYLAGYGLFDEVSAGRNWFGMAAQSLWSSGSAQPALPQIIVFKQTVEILGTTLNFGPRTSVRQVVGTDSIFNWVRGGAIVPVARVGSR